ncbi:MAG: nucleotidyltransferase family protein [Gemmatimonadaceae bacterium]
MRRDDPSASLNEQQARIARAGVKALIPVGTSTIGSTARPFLDYVLTGLADAGITSACLVIGPEHDAIREYYGGDNAPRRLRIDFAIQQEARGTADAVLAAEPFAAGEHVLVLNSDNYYPVAAYRALCEFGGAALIGFDRDALVRQGNINPERIRAFALLETSPDGYLTDIVEKPDAMTFERMGPQALVSMNLWTLPPQIYEACRQIQPSARGEVELQDAVRYAMQQMHVRFRVFPIAAGVLDLSSRGDVAAVGEVLASFNVRL